MGGKAGINMNPLSETQAQDGRQTEQSGLHTVRTCL